ncbi:MAG: hypothetical protein ACSHWR_07290 [Psychromonas sp.]|jgi:hypothetical protein
MRSQILESLRSHAIGHINKHKMNVEIYLTNPVGIGEHSDLMESIEVELKAIAEYHDQLEILDTYFGE